MAITTSAKGSTILWFMWKAKIVKIFSLYVLMEILKKTYKDKRYLFPRSLS